MREALYHVCQCVLYLACLYVLICAEELSIGFFKNHRPELITNISSLGEDPLKTIVLLGSREVIIYDYILFLVVSEEADAEAASYSPVILCGLNHCLNILLSQHTNSR